MSEPGDQPELDGGTTPPSTMTEPGLFELDDTPDEEPTAEESTDEQVTDEQVTDEDEVAETVDEDEVAETVEEPRADDEPTASDDDAAEDTDAARPSGRSRKRRRPSRSAGRPLAVDPFAIDDDANGDSDDANGDSDDANGDSDDAEVAKADDAESESGDATEESVDAKDESGDAEGSKAESDDDEKPRRRRRRGRRGRGRGKGSGPKPDTTPESESSDSDKAETDDGDADDDDADDGGSNGGGQKEGGQNRGGQNRGGQQKGGQNRGGQNKNGQKKDEDGQGDDDAKAESSDDDGEKSGDGTKGESRSSGGRRRRRGRRGRGRRGRSGGGGGGQQQGDKTDDAGAPTRLSARSQRSGGRRRVPSVSPETRRVMAESPPKRMLVTVGKERTQIAVLEERTLVEHYVTQASEQSYVGNIYKGRVQNVLPGMEAAFIDIGKGRNGVLYAGEVNYDEADRDGNLPRIEQALKSGQPVMVQVTKDPMGTKGARLTQHLSLAGRYCVLAPGDDMLGISRKLPDEQRDRLRKILKDLKPEGFGLIVRTAAESATAEQLEADVTRLLERWKKVEEKAEAAKPLESIYSEPQLVLRVIRDVFGPEHTQLIIDDEELAEQVRSYLQEVSPEHVDKVVTYSPPAGEDGKIERLFDAYEVTTQIRRALEKKVWLKSGGYLIIEKTEAMWVIDVNTGKFVGKDNLEETVLRNNIEAAEEIARQLRLRDMGGIIVIDFVDMIVPANREEVLKRFKRELARDKTKSRVMEISKLGLVQMTRKNVSKGLMEAFTEETDDVIPGRRIVEDLLA